MGLRPHHDSRLQAQHREFAKILERSINLGVEFFDNWCPRRPFDGEEWGLAPLAIYRSILEKLDGATVLVEYSCVESLAIVMRTAFESLLQLMYLFKDRTRERSLAYFYFAIQEYEEDCKKLGLANEDISKPLAPAYDPVIAEVARIQREHKQKKKKKEKKLTKWYSLFPSSSESPPDSVRQLATHLRFERWYDYLYHPTSQLVHNAPPNRYFSEGPGGITLSKPMRDPESLQGLTALAVRISKWSTQLIVAKYSCDRLPEFDRRFAQEVQRGFRP